MEKQIPKTKEESFAQFDAMLSEEDKNALLEAEDLFFTHFSLGTWIRNNWIYPLSDKELRDFYKMFSDEEESPFGFSLFLPHPDSVSGDIIEKYVEYLKKKRQNEKNR